MINKQIEKYRIIRLIGEGGMAKVYEAVHVKLGTRVAIKILNEELVKKGNIRQRFENEAKIMAELSHPNIVKIIDYIDTDNILAIVMEFLQGKTLTDYIRSKGKLSKEEIIYIFSQVLDAFNLAHRRGVVHRDIKPSNIFLDAKNNNKVKILDFGIAKLVSSDLSLTQTGSQMGSPLYMSPEQVKDASNIDNLSDIYSLGVVLYHMISGKPPYTDSSYSKFDIFNKIVYEPLPELTQYSEFNQIIQKATQKDPSKRYRTCAEFLNDLNNVNNIQQASMDKTIVPGEPKKQHKQKAKTTKKKPVKKVKKTNTRTRKKRQKQSSGSSKGIIAFLLLVVLGGGGYFAYTNYFDKTHQPTPKIKTTVSNEGDKKTETKKVELISFKKNIYGFTANSIAETSDGKYLLSGTDKKGYKVLALSYDGEEETPLITEHFPVSKIVTNDKNEYFVGGVKNNKIIIKKYKHKKQKWEYTGPLKFKQPKINNIYVDNKGNVIVIGNHKVRGKRQDAFIIKIDKSGNKSGKLTIGTNKKDILYDMIEENNRYFFVGETAGKVWVLVTDNSLNKTKDEYYDFGKKATSIAYVNNAVYVTGEKFTGSDIDVFLMKFDPKGSKDWDNPKVFGKSNMFETNPKVVETNNNLVISTTQSDTNNQNRIWVFNTNLTGKKQDRNINLSDFELKSAIKSKDEGVVITAIKNNESLVKKFYIK